MLRKKSNEIHWEFHKELSAEETASLLNNFILETTHFINKNNFLRLRFVGSTSYEESCFFIDTDNTSDLFDIVPTKKLTSVYKISVDVEETSITFNTAKGTLYINSVNNRGERYTLWFEKI